MNKLRIYLIIFMVSNGIFGMNQIPKDQKQKQQNLPLPLQKKPNDHRDDESGSDEVKEVKEPWTTKQKWIAGIVGAVLLGGSVVGVYIYNRESQPGNPDTPTSA